MKLKKLNVQTQDIVCMLNTPMSELGLKPAYDPDQWKKFKEDQKEKMAKERFTTNYHRMLRAKR